MQQLIDQAARSADRFRQAAREMTAAGRLEDAAWADRLARYSAWRREQLTRLLAGDDRPLPTFASWRGRGQEAVGQQLTLFQ